MVAHHFKLPHDQLAAFCRKWKITEFAVFGSVLRDDFSPDSDVDCLVVFAPDSTWSLLDVIGAEQELEQLMGRPVDLVERKTIEESSNPVRKRKILDSARVLYAG